MISYIFPCTLKAMNPNFVQKCLRTHVVQKGDEMTQHNEFIFIPLFKKGESQRQGNFLGLLENSGKF